jgi:hypothetical protein
MFGTDWLYQLTPRDRAGDALAIAAQTHTPFGRSVTAATIVDRWEVSSDVPNLWTIQQLHGLAAPGGAQTLTGFSIRVEGRSPGNDVTIIDEIGLTSTAYRRTLNINPLTFDSRTHSAILFTYQFSAGAVANLVASQVLAVFQPLGNVAPASFLVSGAP